MIWTAILPSGNALYPNDSVVSDNGRYHLNLQGDGNLVLYDVVVSPWKVLWASNTAGQAVSRCIMQTDGNFVLYGYPGGKPGVLFATNTANHPNASLYVQDDGNTVIYQPHAPIWASNEYFINLGY